MSERPIDQLVDEISTTLETATLGEDSGLIPRSRELSLAKTKLEEARFWTRQAAASAPVPEPQKGCRGCRVLIGYTHLADCPREGTVTADDI